MISAAAKRIDGGSSGSRPTGSGTGKKQPLVPVKPTKPVKSTAKPAAKVTPMPTARKVAPWQRADEDDDGLTDGGEGHEVERGANAVLHTTDPRGRRSAAFPDINISATARRLGVTTAHLAKVLAGVNRPSIDLALKIAEALGTDLYSVIALYKSQTTVTEVPGKKRAVKKAPKKRK